MPQWLTVADCAIVFYIFRDTGVPHTAGGPVMSVLLLAERSLMNSLTSPLTVVRRIGAADWLLIDCFLEAWHTPLRGRDS